MLEFDGIEKSFHGVPALRRVSLRVGKGRVLGLVGENGAGKSTMMNILGGVIPQDAGRILIDGAPYFPRSPADASRHGIAFIHQELSLFTNLSVAENLFIDGFPKRGLPGLRFIDRAGLQRGAQKLLEEVGLEVPAETLVERLSPGERQLVEIAKALRFKARIAIFDEPTTSLTGREAARLFGLIGRLQVRGITVLYISHILADVFRLCQDIVVLRDGQVVGAGPAGDFTLDGVIALMVGRSLEQYYPRRSGAPSQAPALQVRGLSQPGALENITFDLCRGEILGVAGLLGAGRTELARALFGLEKCAAGAIRIAGSLHAPRSPRASIRRKVAFVSEDRRADGLLAEATVAENIALVALESNAAPATGLIDQRGLARSVEKAASAARLRLEEVGRRPARTLSGGNQQKTVLAKWLPGEPEIFILDEPTRGIDVGARHEFYGIINGMADRGAGVIFISSEIEELIGMCDRILVMRAGEMAGCFGRADFDRERILRCALGGSAA